MLRDEWKFEYNAERLCEAAMAKHAFHRERVEWWKSKKEQIVKTIRSEGLEIDEKLVMEHQSLKSRDWQNATRVTVRDDLRANLSECLQKLAHHTERANTFDGWSQVLRAHPSARLELHHQDWLFFFGSEDTSP